MSSAFAEHAGGDDEGRLSRSDVDAYWRVVNSARVNVWKETKNHVFAKGLRHLQYVASDNVALWQSERLERDGLERKRSLKNVVPPCDVRVVQGDVWTHAGALTREFGQIFAVTTPVSVQVPGNYVWRGQREPEADFARRSNSSLFLPRGKPALYSEKMAKLLHAGDGLLPLHTADMRVVLRGPEVLRNMSDAVADAAVSGGGIVACGGYEWLYENDIFPVYEMPAAFDPDNVNMHDLVHAQLRTAVAAKARYLLLRDFGCNYPASRPRYNPWHLADAYRACLEDGEFYGAFSVVVFVTSPRFFNVFERILKPLLRSSTQAGPLQADAQQSGGAAQADAQQSGGAAQADAQQSGGAAQADAQQSGSAAQADAQQSGSAAQADAQQSGSAAQADAQQSGSAAQADAQQSGGAAQADAQQSGSAAQADAQQYGSAAQAALDAAQQARMEAQAARTLAQEAEAKAQEAEAKAQEAEAKAQGNQPCAHQPLCRSIDVNGTRVMYTEFNNHFRNCT